MGNRAVILMHEEMEGPGLLEPALRRSGFDVVLRFRSAEASDDAAPLVVAMGGPMAVYDEDRYPFLSHEIALLKARLAAGRPCLGICLGAQLLAAAAGARVHPGKGGLELGVFPVSLTAEAAADAVFGVLPEKTSFAHWHQDAYDAVPGAARLACTERYGEQAFRLGNSYGIQFHPELDAAMFKKWLEASPLDVQRSGRSLDEMLRGDVPKLEAAQPLAEQLLEGVARHFAKAASLVTSPAASPGPGALAAAAPRRGRLVERALGRTGERVLPVSLGGEGILRTTGRSRQAVPVILEALRLGVRYCDTAPAYQQSQDYYGAAFREAGPGARRSVFLASKTHQRSRDGSLRLLENSLKRLGTDHLDLWQLHDLRVIDELDEIFGAGGAIEALERAKADGRVRFVGITGHCDPAVLVEAIRRYPFDNVLCAINPADRARLSFLESVVPVARQLQMGVVGMKVLGAGRIVADRVATAPELIRYAASHADTVIIGCWTVEEVRANLAVAEGFTSMSPQQLADLESKLEPMSSRYDDYKRD